MLSDILNRRKQEKQVSEEGRLPPGQSLTNKFPVLHYGPTPKTDLAEWDFKIFGLVKEEKKWDWQEFNKLPQSDLLLDIHCVTRWSKFDTRWRGVNLKSLVNAGIINLELEANFVVQHCEGGYTTNLPLEIMLLENVILATHYEDEPLPLEHGWPLRVVIGSFRDRSESHNAYFWKGGKWLRALEFTNEDHPGFWEVNGYHNEGDPFKEQRFSYRW